jgi:cobalamin synthase
MKRIKQFGLILTICGVLLLIWQFLITFTIPTDSIAKNREFNVWVFIPLILLFTGVYIFYYKVRTPGIESQFGRIMLSVIASGALSGAIFIVVLILVLFLQGIESVDQVLIYTRWILIALTACFFPFVYMRLR